MNTRQIRDNVHSRGGARAHKHAVRNTNRRVRRDTRQELAREKKAA